MRIVDKELLPPRAPLRVYSRQREAMKHPKIFESGLSHWSCTEGEDKKHHPNIILVFDPECKRCQETLIKQERSNPPY